MVVSIVICAAVAIVVAEGIGWIVQVRGARRFDERYEKMSESEKACL